MSAGRLKEHLRICMNFILTLLTCAIFLFNTSPVFAQNTPSPTTPPQQSTQFTNEFTVENEPEGVVALLQSFIQGFDSFIGGFIFYTPDPLGNTITLKDDAQIPGITKYRDMFYQITIPILAIIIAGIAVSKLGSDNVQELKSFGVRLLITVILFITVPHILSYSVQANNLLVARITETRTFTGFLDTYFDKTQEQIEQGETSEKFGIPSFDISLTGGIFRSLGKFVVQVFLFALTFLFLLMGFLYIGFQFVIRFAALLFLDAIFPVVLPFMLAERTQMIVYTFFKSWFTFLIQQPAFVLGFAIATDIFNSILTASGPSVGMLFFYTGFLFFLGGVNILTARIFGDTWTAFSTNMAAAVAYRGTTAPVAQRASNFKRGLIGGNGSMSTALGQKIRHKWDTRGNGEDNGSSNGGGAPNGKPSNGSGGYPKRTYGGGYSQSGKGQYGQGGLYNLPVHDTRPNLSRSLGSRGMNVQMENYKQGVVSVSGEAYRHDDPKTGLTTLYPQRHDAIRDGVPDDQLQKVTLDGNRYIDMSAFSKDNPNPHNFNAMQEAKRQGKEINYGYVNQSSPPQKVKQFLDLSDKRNAAYGIDGVIVRRQGKDSSDHIIRLYSQGTKKAKKS